MLRKIILSSLVLGSVTMSVTQAYAYESQQETNPMVLYEGIDSKSLYTEGTVISADSNRIVVEYQDENGNIDEVELPYYEFTEVYDMVTGKELSPEEVLVGDKVIVEYAITTTGEVYFYGMLVNIDDLNAADSYIQLANLANYENIKTDIAETTTQKTFERYHYENELVTFDKDTEITDVNGNKLTLSELQANDKLLIWYPSTENDDEITVTKAILIKDNNVEVEGSTTVKLSYKDDIFRNTQPIPTYLPEGATSFWGSDGNRYYFPAELKIVDSNGNSLQVSELEDGDVVNIDYKGINSLYGYTEAIVTSATLDTTDHHVTGTTTMTLTDPEGSRISLDGTDTIIEKIYLSDDGTYQVLVNNEVTTITDINGNPTTVDKLKTGDVVTFDYEAVEYGGQLSEVVATNVVVTETIPTVEGTVTLELGEGFVGRSNIIFDYDGNSVHDEVMFDSADGQYQIIFDSRTQIVDAEGNEVETYDLQKGDIVTIEYVGRKEDGQFKVRATSATVEDQIKKEVTGTSTITLGYETTRGSSEGELIYRVFESEDNNYIVKFESTSPILDEDGNKVDIEELKSGDVVTIEYVGAELDGRFNVVATSTVVEQSYEF